MTATAVGAATTRNNPATRTHWFLWAAGFVTVAPWVIALGHTGLPADRHLLVVVSVWLGLPHVASTAALYADRDLRPMMRGPRYWQWPAVLVVGCAVAAGVGGVNVLLVVNSLWALHHFAKQNLGMVSFTQRARRQPGPSPLDRRVIVATGVAAMLGYQAILLPKLGVQVDTAPLSAAGLVILAGCAVAVWRSPARLPMTLAVVFFLPLFLGLNAVEATAAYGAAHAAQYLLMVGVVSRPQPRTAVVFVVSVVLGGWLLIVWGAGTGWLYGAVVGVNLAHFVIDAGVWKMTTPEKRAYMKSRFSFL